MRYLALFLIVSASSVFGSDGPLEFLARELSVSVEKSTYDDLFKIMVDGVPMKVVRRSTSLSERSETAILESAVNLVLFRARRAEAPVEVDFEAIPESGRCSNTQLFSSFKTPAVETTSDLYITLDPSEFFFSAKLVPGYLVDQLLVEITDKSEGVRFAFAFMPHYAERKQISAAANRINLYASRKRTVRLYPFNDIETAVSLEPK